jgi:hypothetical protein
MRVKHQYLQFRLEYVVLDVLVARWLAMAVDRKGDNWSFGVESVGDVLISRLHIDPSTGEYPTHYRQFVFGLLTGASRALSPHFMQNPCDVRQWLRSILGQFEPNVKTYTWISILGWGHQLVMGTVTPECVSFTKGSLPRLCEG